MFRIVSICLLGISVTACAKTYRGEFDGTGEPVTFERHAGICLDSLTLTLSNGETYIGYMLMSPEEVDGSGCQASELAGMSPDATVMFSDRAGMMRCELEGQRTCRLSDGRSIVVERAGTP